ncbi:MAG TPA: hypothetical protein VIV11_06010 [Kofleriaceae bacterium]
MRGGLVLLTAVLVAAPGSAHAGRTFYGWLYGSEVMPERGVELQSWITEHNFVGRSEDSWLFGAQVGVTDQLEIGFPFEIDWFAQSTATPPAGTRFARFGVEARYRFVTQDPVEAPALVPLLRVAVKRDVADRHGAQPEADLVVSYESGIVQVLVDIGFVAAISPDRPNTYALRPGAGVSVLAIEDLRFGAEFISEIGNNGPDWFVVGPNISWTHGRFWLSGSLGAGLNQDVINSAARAQWGIAF